MPFLRLTRDRRGYENTFLLHAAHPGERPRVLYWYRSAPGVRVGRPALDEDAIRTIEEQHPDVDFDWPHILEVGAASPPEVERPLVRPRRKPERVRDEPRPPAEAVDAIGPAEDTEIDTVPVDPIIDETAPLDEAEDDAAQVDDAANVSVRAHDMLAELVGREIATRLRARYAEISARLHQLPASDPRRDAAQRRADALDPDSWVTPEEILHGVRHADELFDALRRELLS